MLPKSLSFPGYMTELITRQHPVSGEWVTSSETFPVRGGGLGVYPGTSVNGNFWDPNPWSYEINRSQGLIGFSSSKNRNDPGQTVYLNNFLSDNPGTGSDWPSGVQDQRLKARDKAVKKLSDSVQGSLNLATSIAEAGQTYKMLNLVERYKNLMTILQRSYIKSVYEKGFHQFRRVGTKRFKRLVYRWRTGLKKNHGLRVKWSSPGHLSRASSLGANGWLEYTYGLNPLIQDIAGVARNVIGQVRNFLNSFTSRASDSSPLEYAVSLSAPYPAKGRNRISSRARYRYTVRLEAYDPLLARWTSINPIGVAYELLPYSFVLDWFVDLSGYMRSLETSLRYGKLFRGGFESVMTHSVAKSNYSSKTGSNPVLKTVGGGIVQQTVYSRSLLEAFPTPRFPILETDLGSNRLISAASLLRQLIRK